MHQGWGIDLASAYTFIFYACEEHNTLIDCNIVISAPRGKEYKLIAAVKGI